MKGSPFYLVIFQFEYCSCTKMDGEYFSFCISFDLWKLALTFCRIIKFNDSFVIHYRIGRWVSKGFLSPIELKIVQVQQKIHFHALEQYF